MILAYLTINYQPPKVNPLYELTFCRVGSEVLAQAELAYYG